MPKLWLFTHTPTLIYSLEIDFAQFVGCLMSYMLFGISIMQLCEYNLSTSLERGPSVEKDDFVEYVSTRNP